MAKKTIILCASSFPLINQDAAPERQQLELLKPEFGQQYWDKIIIFDMLVEEGTITQRDREFIRYADRAEQAWHLILESYTKNGNKHSDNKQAML